MEAVRARHPGQQGLLVSGPLVMAHERTLPVGGALGQVLPGTALRRGTVVGVTGPGAATVVLELLAAATDLGDWVTVVERAEGVNEFAGLAAVEAGVALDRCAVVRHVPTARWAVVIGALLEGMAMVVAHVPPRARAADARRLVARARERQSILVVDEGWPVEAAVRIHAGTSRWYGLEQGDGLLARCDVAITVEGKGAPRSSRLDLERRPVVARAG